MNKIDHGGFAFPTQAICTPSGDVMSSGDDGMTLRDWFAGQALTAIVEAARNQKEPAKIIAIAAYEVADAMIVARVIDKAEGRS